MMMMMLHKKLLLITGIAFCGVATRDYNQLATDDPIQLHSAFRRALAKVRGEPYSRSGYAGHHRRLGFFADLWENLSSTRFGTFVASKCREIEGCVNAYKTKLKAAGWRFDTRITWENSEWLKKYVAEENYIENVMDLNLTKKIHRDLYFHLPFLGAAYCKWREDMLAPEAEPKSHVQKKLRGYTLDETPIPRDQNGDGTWNCAPMNEDDEFCVWYHDTVEGQEGDEATQKTISRKVHIGFRGSRDLKDWITNVTLPLNGSKSICKWLAKYFTDLHGRAEKKFCLYLDLEKEWKKQAQENQPDYEFQVTDISISGHSLGGEIASEFATILEAVMPTKFKRALFHNAAMIGWVLGLSDQWLYQVLDTTGKYIFLANEGDPLTQRLQDFLQPIEPNGERRSAEDINNIFIVKRRPGMNWADCHKRDLPWTPKNFTYQRMKDGVVTNTVWHKPFGKNNMVELFRSEEKYFAEQEDKYGEDLKHATQEILERIAAGHRKEMGDKWTDDYGDQSEPFYVERSGLNLKAVCTVDSYTADGLYKNDVVTMVVNEDGEEPVYVETGEVGVLVETGEVDSKGVKKTLTVKKSDLEPVNLQGIMSRLKRFGEILTETLRDQ